MTSKNQSFIVSIKINITILGITETIDAAVEVAFKLLSQDPKNHLKLIEINTDDDFYECNIGCFLSILGIDPDRPILKRVGLY